MKQREIKFRAFDRNSEMKYDVWPVGDTVYNPNGGFWLHNVQAVMQYTGLKDKNGKEIYEGDIIRVKDFELVEFGEATDGYYEKYTDCVSVVEYYAPSFSFKCFYGDAALDHAEIDSIEIIGNIYEHPNLLKP